MADLTKPMTIRQLVFSIPFFSRYLFSKRGNMDNKYPEEPIMYDLSILAELDDSGYMLEMISLFLSNYPPELAEMSRLLEAADWSGVEAKAHKLKGSVGILQATTVFSLLATIENNARQQQGLDEIPQQLEQLKQLFAKLDAQLRQEQEQIKQNMA